MFAIFILRSFPFTSHFSIVRGSGSIKNAPCKSCSINGLASLYKVNPEASLSQPLAASSCGCRIHGNEAEIMIRQLKDGLVNKNATTVLAVLNGLPPCVSVIYMTFYNSYLISCLKNAIRCDFVAGESSDSL